MYSSLRPPDSNLEVNQIENNIWKIPRQGKMLVPAFLFANQQLIQGLDQLVFTQLANVASLPGIVEAAYAMPDAHSGYGFPIGGVAAFSKEKGGVISAGGVGFDIACGVRALLTPLAAQDIRDKQKELADALFKAIPAGVDKGGELVLNTREMEAVLRHGAHWAVSNGFGFQSDLERCEENGMMQGALPEMFSDKAKERQKNEVGTLGPETIIWKFKRWLKSSIRMQPRYSVCAKGRQCAPYIAAHVDWGTRLVRTICSVCGKRRNATGSRCKIHNLLAPPCVHSLAGNTWGPCALASIAPLPTGRFSPTWCARPLLRFLVMLGSQ